MPTPFDPVKYLENQRQAAQLRLDDAALRLMEKRQEIEAATQEKIAAMIASSEAYKQSQTTLGKVMGLGVDSDMSRTLIAGAVEGTGLVAAGIGHLIDNPNMINAYKGIKEFSDKIKAGQDVNFTYEMENSTPIGNVLDPSSVGFSDKATLRGFVANVANVFGQMAPILVGSALTEGMLGAGVLGGATVGFTQAAGAGGQDATDYINGLSDTEMVAQIPLAKELYNNASGTPREKLAQVREQIAKEAAQVQALVGGTIGGFGGAVLGKLANPATNKMVSSLSGRAGLLAGGTVSEGVEEVAESLAGRQAVNSELGTNRDIGEGTFADLVLGAAAGGGTAVVGEARSLAKGDLQKAKDKEDFVKVKQALGTVTDAASFDALLKSNEHKTENIAAALVSEIPKATEKGGEEVVALRDKLQKTRNALVADKEKFETVRALHQTPKDITKVSNDLDRLNKIRNSPDLEEGQKEKADLYIHALQKEKEVLESGIMDNPTEVKKYLRDNKNLNDNESYSKLLDTLDSSISIMVTPEEVKAKETAQQEDSVKLTTAVETVKNVEAAPEARQSSLNEAVILLMKNPDLATEDSLKALEAAEGLTEEQKTYVRQLSTTAQANNQLSNMIDVSQDVLGRSRSNNFKSLQDHTTAIKSALSNNDVEGAKSAYDKFSAFVTSHVQKAEMVGKAFHQAKAAGKNVQVLAVNEKGSNSWEINTKEPLSKLALSRSGSYDIHRGSGNFVTQLQTEAKILEENRNFFKTWIEQKAVPSESTSTNTKTVTSGIKDSLSDTSVEAPVEVPSTPAAIQPPVEASVAPVKADNTNTLITAESVPENTIEAPIETPSVQSEVQESNNVKPEEQDSVTSEEEYSTVEQEEKIESQEIAEEEAAISVSEKVEGHLPLEERKSRNLLKAYFGRKKDHVFNNKDFITQFFSNPRATERVKSLLDSNVDVSIRQQELLQSVVAYAQKFIPTVQNMFNVKHTENKQYNITQYLVAEDAQGNRTQLARLAASAIIMSALHTLHAQTQQPLFRQEDQVLEAFKSKDPKIGTPIYQSVMQRLQSGGVARNILIEELGKTASSILGFKAHRKAPAQLKENMINELGVIALEFLEHQGLIEPISIPMSSLVHAGIIAGNAEASEHGKLIMYRPTREKNKSNERIYTKPIETIIARFKGTKDILGSVFSVDSAAKWPSKEPVKKPFFNVKHSFLRVPLELAKRVFKASQQKHFIREDIGGENGLFHILSRKTLEAAAGIKHYSGSEVIKSKQAAIDGKNAGLRSELDNLFEFLGAQSVTEPFYLNREYWSIHRVGIASNIFNPLQNKTHRIAMTMEGHEYKVPLNSDKPSQELNEFKLAVLEGLGVKTDKMEPAIALVKWEEKLSTPEIAKAIEVLREVAVGVIPTEEQQQHIVDGVTKAGEAMHSLDALWQWARYEAAKQMASNTKEKYFTATLVREADGVNNGPILSFLQAGIFNLDNYRDWRNKGGFFNKNDQHSNAGAFAQDPTTRDLYETVAHAAVKVLATEKIHPFWSNLMGDTLDKSGKVTKVARNLFKPVVTKIVFGSGTTGSVNSIGHELFDMWLDSVQALYDNTRGLTEKEQTEKIADTFNKFFTGTGIPIPKDFKPTRDYIQSKDFVREFYPSFISAFSSNLGFIIEDSVENELAPFMDVRNSVHKISSKIYDVFIQLYEIERNKYVQDLINRKIIATTTKENPFDDLTTEQYEALNKRMLKYAPLFKTALGKTSPLNAGLLQSPETSARVTDTISPYVSSVSLTVNGTKRSASYRGKRKSFEETGARAFVTFMHSIDSAIASSVYQNHNLLNVHDAAIASPHILNEAMKGYNKSTFNIMANTSIVEESLVNAYRVLINVEDNFRHEISTNSKLKAAIESLQETVLDNQDFFNVVDTNRIASLKDMDIVHQYGYAGTAYEVTEADKQKLNSIPKLKYRVIQRLLREKTLTQEVLNTPTSYANSILSIEDNASKSVQIAKGNPVVPVTPSLQEFFARAHKNKQSITVRDISPFITKDLDSSVKGVMQRRLLKGILKILPQDFKVEYITPDSELAKQLKGSIDLDSVAGFLHSSASYVGVLSPEFKGSNLNTEMLMHELIHAALTYTINNPTTETKPLIKNLDILRQQAKELIKKLPVEEQKQFVPAVESVDEFVAWGLSNPKFQNEVLGKLEVNTSSFYSNRGHKKLNKLINGLRAFIETTAKIIFGDKITDSRTDVVDGLQALIINAAGLTSQASKEGLAGKPTSSILKMVNTYMDMSPNEVLKALGQSENITDNHMESLQEVMSTLVTNIHTGLNPFMETLKQQGKANPVEAFEQMALNNTVPMQSDILMAGMHIDKASLFVAEQLDMTLRTALDSSTLAYEELQKLFREAKNKITAKDFIEGAWDTASPLEKSRATNVYNKVFNYSGNSQQRRNGMLAQFAALALTYPPLQKALNYTPVGIKPDSDRIGARIVAWYKKLLYTLGKFIYQTKDSQNVSERIKRLAQGLVIHQQHKQQQLASKTLTVDRILDMADSGVHEFFDKANSKGASLTQGMPRLARLHKFIQLYRKGQLDEFAEQFEHFRATKMKSRSGILSKLITEVRGDTPYLRFAVDSVTNMVKLQQDRQHEIENTKHLFKEILNDATTTEESALTQIVIRGDLASLFGTESVKDIRAMLSDVTLLDSKIADIENQIDKITGSDLYYKNAAFALAVYLASDISITPLLSLNAYAIASKKGTDQKPLSPEKIVTVEPLIDQLVSLYALKEQRASDKTAVITYLERQGDNANNILENVIRHHAGMVKEAHSSLFSTDKMLMQKGYIRELYDPYVSVKAVTADEVETAKNQGYQLKHELLKDRWDITKEKRFLMFNPYVGKAVYNTAAISLTAEKYKGSMFTQELEGERRNKYFSALVASESQILSSPNFIKKFREQDFIEQRPVPVRNNRGDIVGLRYMMDRDTKDDLLRRDTKISNVMGALAGSLYDKVNTPQHNEEVIQALKDNWEENKNTKAGMYVDIGPMSSNTREREIYAMLPQATRDTIKRIWKTDSIKIREDAVDMIFGYRDYRFSETLNKDNNQRTFAEDMAAKMFFTFLGKNAPAKLDKFQDSWEQVVKLVKNIYVIRNLKTLTGNIMSNITLLAWFGVPMKDMVRDHRIAFTALHDYQLNFRELSKLKTLKANNMVHSIKNMDERIAELEQLLKDNPVKSLIDAGQFPTILEDIDAEQDSFDFKPYLYKQVDSFNEKLPNMLVDTGKTLMVSEGTPVYKMLHRTTQMSDFIAKYTLYRYLMQKGSTEEEAQRTIREAFINYELPTSRELHFANATGLMLFTRYFFRIQKVLTMLFRDKPVRALLLALADHFLGNIADVQESWIGARLGNNPLEAGALEIFNALDEPIVMNEVLSLL